MSRIFFHLDETQVLKPKSVLRCCGSEASLTERELDDMLQETVWLKNILRAKRGDYYAGLAAKYKEVERV